MKVLASMGLGETDAELIYAAAHLGKTRHGEEKHGKGMSDLPRLLEEGRSGHMRILSRHGDYAYVHRAPGETHHRTPHLSTAFHGTYLDSHLCDPGSSGESMTILIDRKTVV